jgi:uncharacterized protein
MIVDANMHWLPADLFTDKTLRDAFVDCVSMDAGEYDIDTQIKDKAPILGGNASRLFKIGG